MWNNYRGIASNVESETFKTLRVVILDTVWGQTFRAYSRFISPNDGGWFTFAIVINFHLGSDSTSLKSHASRCSPMSSGGKDGNWAQSFERIIHFIWGKIGSSQSDREFGRCCKRESLFSIFFWDVFCTYVQHLLLQDQNLRRYLFQFSLQWIFRIPLEFCSKTL